jgi:hypothetical protein
MRIFLVLLVAAGIVFAIARNESRKKQVAQAEAAAEQKQASERVMQKRREEADKQVAERDRRFAVSMECDTAISNRQVLHDAMQRGGQVFAFRGGSAPKTPAEMRAAFDEMQAFIDRNCAEAVQARRGPGGAFCSGPQAHQLVCKQ